MEIRDLEVGDVLLFSAEKGSFISWAITFLTDAPVSHAAMYYGEKNEKASIIEETPPAVAINPAVDRFVDRTITVRRLNSGASLAPVIAAAEKYCNASDPYDNAGLYMVGAILLYKKFTPSSLVQKVVIKILKKLTATLDAYINSHKYPGQQPMVCSQFVAQCYEDAGAQYTLDFQGALLQGVRGESLIDQAVAVVAADENQFALRLLTVGSAIVEEPSETAEQLCEELHEAFVQSNATLATASISPELIEAMCRFSQASSRFFSTEASRAGSFEGDAVASLQFLKDNENMFIFPGDLLLHCTNLKDVGTIGCIPSVN